LISRSYAVVRLDVVVYGLRRGLINSAAGCIDEKLRRRPAEESQHGLAGNFRVRIHRNH
jgi:hypothetical protein